jgi:hypothetical protein
VALSAVARSPGFVEDAVCKLLLERISTAKTHSDRASVDTTTNVVPAVSTICRVSLANRLNRPAGNLTFVTFVDPALIEATYFSVTVPAGTSGSAPDTSVPLALNLYDTPAELSRRGLITTSQQRH